MTQLARLGVGMGWFGKIGDDEAGKIVLQDIAKEGIDSSHVEVVKGEPSCLEACCESHGNDERKWRENRF